VADVDCRVSTVYRIETAEVPGHDAGGLAFGAAFELHPAGRTKRHVSVSP
jgi:hypothetical protein